MSSLTRLRTLLKHGKWHIGMGADLHRLGLPRDTFFRAYYRTRIRSALSKDDSTDVTPFTVRHGVTGKATTVHLRTGPAPDDLSDWIVLRGVWAHQDYFHPLVLRCETILDVGTNIGISALWFNRLLPRAQLACVEPDPANIPLARLNLHRNGIEATFFECAVAPYAGSARLGIERFKGKSSVQDVGLYSHSEFVDVPSRRIPDILDDLGWRHVDLLKLDIEGMERDVLADCGDWIDRVRLIIMEVHQNTSPAELAGFLKPCGWSVKRVGLHDEETYVAICRQWSTL